MRDDSTTAETLLMFLFFFALTMCCQGSGARRCCLPFSCFLGNCSFLPQDENSGCNSTFLLLHTYSPVPLIVSPVITPIWGKSVEGEVWKVPDCMHKSRETFTIHIQSFHPRSPLQCNRWGVDWKRCSLCAQCHSCWILPSQQLVPLPTFPLAWRGEPHAVLTTLNTQKSCVKRLLIVGLALKSQGIKPSIFFMPSGSGATRDQGL